MPYLFNPITGKLDYYATAAPGVTDHGALTGLGDDDHTQYALADKSRPSPWVSAADLSVRSLADLGTRDHDLLTGLTDDDHSQYLRLAGRVGGQLGIGGAGTGENLSFRSNAVQDGLIILGDDITKNEQVVVHGTEAGLTIGGTAFLSHFTVHDEGSAGHANVVIHKHSGIGVVGPTLAAARTRGTEGAELAVADDDVLCRFLGLGYDGTDFERAAQITLEVDDPTPSATSMGGAIVLSTTPTGTVALVDRLRVAQDGRVTVAGSGFGVNGLPYVWPGSQAASRVLKTDGSSNLSWGQVAFSELSGSLAHSSLSGIGANDHHNQAHVLATNLALGGDHTISGATAGHVLRASSATAAAFAALNFSDLAGTLAHSALSGLTPGDAGHTGLALLAGRAGTANNIILSTSGDGTLQGSSATGGALILNGGALSSAVFPVEVTPSMAGVANMFGVEVAHDVTFTAGVGAVANAITVSEHGSWLVQTNLASGFGLGGRGFVFAPSIRNDANRTDMGVYSAFLVTGDVYSAAGTTISAGNTAMLFDPFAVGQAANAGTLIWTSHTSLQCGPQQIVNGTGTTTLDTRRGVWYRAASGTGSLTNDIALDIESLTKAATLSAGVRSAITSGTGRWFLLGTGSADSSLGGRLFVGNTGSVVPSVDLDVDGDFATRAANLALVNGNNDNIAIGARSFIRVIGPTAAFVIRGIASGFDGKRLTIYNTTTQNMTINNQDAGSTAANRIITMTGAAVASTGEGAFEFIYDATQSRWLMIGRSGV